MMTQRVDNISHVNNEGSQSELETLSNLLLSVIGLAGFQLDFSIKREPGPQAQIRVEFKGPDAALLTARNGELLNALEFIGAKALRLEQEEHDRVVFDANSFKAKRDRDLQHSAAEAIASVRRTGKPYAFAPMSSHERRLLHMALSESGLPTASSGEPPRRYVVLYPESYRSGAPDGNVADDPNHTVKTEDRANAIRNSFRRRQGP
jgi:spoIIIJ-associated protein